MSCWVGWISLLVLIADARATMSSQTTHATQATATPAINISGGASTSAGPPVNQAGSSSGSHIPRAHSATPIASPSQHPSPGSPRHQSGSIDVEGHLRSHGGDLRRTLEAVVSERNSLVGMQPTSTNPSKRKTPSYGNSSRSSAPSVLISQVITTVCEQTVNEQTVD